MAYTKQQYLDELTAASRDLRSLVQHPLLNLRGTAADGSETYTELAAAWAADHWDLFADLPTITPALPYRDPLRDGTRPRRMSRAEQLLSRDLYCRYHPGTAASLHIIGDILDYQMPLSDRASDRAGTVDLVAWDGQVLRLLKLVTRSSSDSMVRCLLESSAHLRTVNQQKLLADLALPEHAEISAAPFVYLEGQQKEDLKQHPAALHRLLLISGLRPIYYVP